MKHKDPWTVRLANWLLRRHVRREAKKHPEVQLGTGATVIFYSVAFDFVRDRKRNGEKRLMCDIITDHGRRHWWSRVNEGSTACKIGKYQKATCAEAIVTVPPHYLEEEKSCGVRFLEDEAQRRAVEQ